MLVSSFLEGEKTISTFQSYLNDYRVYVKDYIGQQMPCPQSIEIFVNNFFL